MKTLSQIMVGISMCCLFMAYLYTQDLVIFLLGILVLIISLKMRPPKTKDTSFRKNKTWHDDVR